MGRKTVALSLDKDVYEQYRKFCEENGIILSKQVEFFMKKINDERKCIYLNEYLASQ